MEGVSRFGCALALVACASAFAGTPHLVRNINESTTAVSSNPTDFIDQGSWSFFNAQTGSGLQYRLFATDGTTKGTFRLASADPMPNATGYQTTRAGRLTFWSVTGTGPGSALWVSDGTSAGTRLVIDFGTTGNTGLYGTVALGDTLFFPVYETSVAKLVLWRSDGTRAGTYRVTDSNGPNLVGGPAILAVGQQMYFLAFTADKRLELWSSDGTAGGTAKVAALADSAPESGAYPMLVRAGGYLLFAATTSTSGRELVRFDLSARTLVLVTDIAPGSASGVSTDTPMISLGNVALFGATPTGGSSYTLWRSDGTAAGTYSLGAVAPQGSALPNYSGIVPTYYIQPSGTKAYFLGDDGSTGKQLYISDGTVAGTLRLSSSPTAAWLVANPGSSFYFSSDFAGTLMRTDGTLAGTQPVAPLQNSSVGAGYMEVAGDGATDFIRVQDSLLHYNVYRYDVAGGALTLLTSYSKGSIPATPRVFAYARGKLFFDGEDPVHGHEPWVSDGTAAGTYLLSNVAQELGNPSSPSNFAELNSELYFSADDGINGRELWTSDGTHDGTQPVIDINAGSADSNPVGLFSAGGSLYFFAQSPTGFNKLWKSDGTAQGTRMLAAIDPPPLNSPCGPGVAIGNTIFFAAGDSQGGLELWKTDGTNQGTLRVADIKAGAASSNPCYLTAVNGRLFFAADGDSVPGGMSLWSSDGSAAGTTRVTSAPLVSPHALIGYNGLLYFIAGDPIHGEQLWTSDGTEAGTAPVTEISPESVYPDSGSLLALNGKLLFSWMIGPFGNTEVWSFDGTHSTLLNSSPSTSVQQILVSDGAHVYFSAAAPQQNAPANVGPWVTDGTPSGTAPLWDVSSEFAGRAPFLFENFHGLGLFQDIAADGSSELWRTGGTLSGTKLIANIGTASNTVYPPTRLTVGNNYFYVSDDGTTGMELFALDNAVPVAANDSGASVTAGQKITINVLANDVDTDGALDPASIVFVTQPTGGAVSVDSSGTVTYSANIGFSGADSFTYTVADTQGGRSSAATVRVTVVAASSGGSGSQGSGSGSSPASGGSSSSGGGGGSVGGLEIAILGAVCMFGWIGRMQICSPFSRMTEVPRTR
jgi:ELWxxDGT repeat protein